MKLSLEKKRNFMVTNVYISLLSPCKAGGRTRLPNFKFSAKFPIGVTHDFTSTDKKIQNLIESGVQNYFSQKSFEVQPCTSLEIIVNGLCFQIIR